MDSVNINTSTVEAAAVLVEGREAKAMTSHSKPKKQKKWWEIRQKTKKEKQTLVQPKCEQRHMCTKEQFGYKMEFNNVTFRRNE